MNGWYIIPVVVQQLVGEVMEEVRLGWGEVAIMDLVHSHL